MERLSFVFTICFILLGPVKIIASFARATRGTPDAFQRRVALWATAISAGICLFVVLLGNFVVARYGLSRSSLQLAGGLVLLLSALRVIFPGRRAEEPRAGQPSALQLAISPVSTPIVVTPAGIAALLIFTMSESMFPGIQRTLLVVLGIILLLDFLAMFFNATVIRTPGLVPLLQVLASVLVFVQAALGVETMISGFRGLGVLAR